MKRKTYLVTQIEIDKKDPKNDGKEFYVLFHRKRIEKYIHYLL